MKSFDDWFAQQKPTTTQQAEPNLPVGVVIKGDGRYYAKCNSCGKDYEIAVDPIKEGWDPDYSYCNGSQWCVP